MKLSAVKHACSETVAAVYDRRNESVRGLRRVGGHRPPLQVLLLVSLFLIPLASRAAADLTALWTDRLLSVVAVEYFIETEIERRPVTAYGVVIDKNGTVILPSASLDTRYPASQIKEMKATVPGEPATIACEYLGQDVYTGWHFVRVGEELRKKLVPITTFAAPGGAPTLPGLAEDVWGIGLRNKDEDYTPYILKSYVALVQMLPQRTAIAQHEVASPGLPVFNKDGVFLGLTASSFGQTFLEYSSSDRGGAPIMLVNVEESSAFITADEILPNLDRIPKSPDSRPLAWLGAYGLEPMEREVANFLKLTSQSGVVVSEVLDGSPAEKGGMKDHDIILAIDGQVLPRFKPDRVVTDYVDRVVSKHVPGDVLAFKVLRGTEQVDLKVTLGDQPKLMREAERKFFDKLGFTAREFVYGDAIARRVKPTEGTGIVAHFVKPNSPVATAGLRTEDWIKEIDGAEVKTFADAAAKLDAITSDTKRTEFVLLVSRGGDTSVLRVKLN